MSHSDENQRQRFESSTPSTSTTSDHPFPITQPFTLPELDFTSSSDPETIQSQGQVHGVSDLRSRFETFNHSSNSLSTTSNPTSIPQSIPPRLPPKIPIQPSSINSSSLAANFQSKPQLQLQPQPGFKSSKPVENTGTASNPSPRPPNLNNLPLPSPIPALPDQPRSPGVSALRSRFDVSSSVSSPASAPTQGVGGGATLGNQNNSELYNQLPTTVPIPVPGQVSRVGSYGFPAIPSSSSTHSINSNGSSSTGPAVGIGSGQSSPSYGFPTNQYRPLPTPPAVPAKPNASSREFNRIPIFSPPVERAIHLRNSSSSSLSTSGNRTPPPIPSRESRSRNNSENSSIPTCSYSNGNQTLSSNHPYSKGSLNPSSSSNSLNSSSTSMPTPPIRSHRSNGNSISTSFLPHASSLLPNEIESRAPPLPSRKTGLESPSEPSGRSDLHSSLPPPPQRNQSSNPSSSQIFNSPTKIRASPQAIRPTFIESNSNGSVSSVSTVPIQSSLSPNSIIPPVPPSRHSNTLPPPIRSAPPIATPNSISRPRSIRPSEDTSEESDLEEDFDSLEDEKEFEKEREKYQFEHGIVGGVGIVGEKEHSKSPLGVISSGLSALKNHRRISNSFQHNHIRRTSTRISGSFSPTSPTSPNSIENHNLSSSSSNRSIRKDNDLPDSSNVNRRPPIFNPDCSISSKTSFCNFSIFGHTIVTANEKGVKIYRIGNTALNGGEKLCLVGEGGKQSENRLTQITFRVETGKDEGGRYVWCGTRSGEIWELDTLKAEITMSRLNLHSCPIVMLTRVGKGMLSLDEGGKLCVWCPSAESPINLSSSPRTQRIPMDKNSIPLVLGDQLWVCSPGLEPPHSHSKNSTINSTSTSTGPKIRIYNPFSDDKPFNAVSRPVSIPSTLISSIGTVTSGTIIPTSKDLVYLGHDSGHISIWNRTTLTCIRVQKLGSFGVTCLIGVVSNLWVGNKTGKISIYKIDSLNHWIVSKRWQGHQSPITDLQVDINKVDGKERLQVASSSFNDSKIQIWDGLLAFDWLDNQLNEKQIEKTFCSEREIRILQCSFNIDAANPLDLEEGDEMELNWLGNLLKSGRRNYEIDEDGNVDEELEILPDVIVFGLQEVIDLESKALTAKNLLMGKKKGKEDMGERVSHQYRAWYDRLVLAVRSALPPTCPYKPILSQSLVGLFSIIFVKVSQLDRCRDMATSTIKTGMGGRYGNKGAIVCRFVLDDTSFCFTNCHLAAGQKHVRQRNDDVADILEASPFEGLLSDPLAYTAGGEGSMILDHSKNFLSGDLNYRIDQPRSTVISLLSSAKLSALLSSDQLLSQLHSNPTFRLKEFQEAPIDFSPTYKYDRGSDEWDSSDKKRIPAWCDRILWRCKVEDDVRSREYRKWDCKVSDHRPISAVFDVKVKSINPTKRAQASRILFESWKAEEARLLADASKYYSD